MKQILIDGILIGIGCRTIVAPLCKLVGRTEHHRKSWAEQSESEDQP